MLKLLKAILFALAGIAVIATMILWGSLGIHLLLK